ncbi:hypothetical protein LCGC14_0678480 [marine sediment metagenome]|uniref:Uncharacterized protein n=2 Tax=root TaxID=1 RepID=A0A9C9NJ98_9HYPH|nr:hypothetical protein [Aurantimonas coralicida]
MTTTPIEVHSWQLVLPQTGGLKWHLWHTAELVSICNCADKRLHEVLESPPRRRFPVCQMCRCYAQRNDLKMPQWAITPKRKRATP